MRRAPLLGLVLGGAAAGPACTAPPEPPLEMPPREVLDELADRVPTAQVQLPLTIDTKSCAFARYVAHIGGRPQSFVLLHPLRSQCEIWLGSMFFPDADLEYCLFPREDLVPVGEDPQMALFRIDDPENCVRATHTQPTENANARAATQAFTKIETN